MPQARRAQIRLSLPACMVEVTLLVIAMFLVSSQAIAEQQYLVANEYVITTSPLKVLQEKAADIISEVEDIAVKSSQNRYMLVTTAPEIWDSPRVRADRAGTSLCVKMARHSRRQLNAIRLTGQRAGSIAALRLRTSYDCDVNAVLSANLVPNDPSFKLLWGLDQTSDNDIDATQAWPMQTGSLAVVIAVIDTGIDYNHPDIAPNMWTNTAEVAGNGIDDDANGFIDDIYGANLVSGAPAPGNPMDDQSHGTHCAGTIGARGNNSVGVVGVAHNVKMMALKFLTSTGSGSLYDAVRAIDYMNMMKSRGVNIKASSNSWGGGGFYQSLYDAIARARDRGILFIAAAGNSSQNITATPSYPASYALDNVVSVASTDETGGRSYFSNYGTSVSIAAPGSNIYSTIPNNGYGYKSGTSMATPHVSGAVALIASQYPNANYQELKARLLGGARVVSKLNGVAENSRFLNLVGALSANSIPPVGGPSPSPTPTASPGTPTPSPTATPTPSPTPTPTPSFYRFSGIVYTDYNTGAGLAGVKVSIIIDGTETRVTYSNNSGDYWFDALPAGKTFLMLREKSGYSIGSSTGRIDNQYYHSVPAIPSTYMVTGRVLDRNRQPLVGAVVQSGNLGSRTTDANGYFAFTGVAHGMSYTLVASKAGETFPLVAGQGMLRGHIDHLFVANTGVQ